MARSMNTAPRRPPVEELPSAPAGGKGGPYQHVSEMLGVVVEHERRRGRGAQSNAVGRYEPLARIAFDDGWRSLDELPPFKTTVQADATRKIITRNDSPDIGFDRSINPYRGCEHGCVYCFARPTHAYLGLSPGLDFESKLFVKPEAAELLERELSAPGYSPKVIAIGTNTDPYQPIERRYKVMRRILEVLDRAGHPVGIVTKSALVLRDLDILARMAERKLAKVALSVTTLDPALARAMEPRAATPARRLEAVRRLSSAGVPTTVMVHRPINLTQARKRRSSPFSGISRPRNPIERPVWRTRSAASGSGVPTWAMIRWGRAGWSRTASRAASPFTATTPRAPARVRTRLKRPMRPCGSARLSRASTK